MPTVSGAPVPSSPLLGDVREGTAELKPWLVPACALQADAALGFLADIGDRPTLGPGVGVGVTLRYWGAALRFAAALVAREQFLPDVVSRRGEWFARWVPTITGADGARFDRLADAMPPACRAVGDAPPDRSAVEFLREFVGFAVDRLVRGTTHEKPRKQFDSVHDRWLHALKSATGAMGGGDTEASHLAGQVREWRAPLAAAHAAPFRLCFRLDEPAEKDRVQAWHVRYLLQGHDDPSLQLPAADVWAGKAKVARADPKPILLAGLGQAANLSPDVEASLKATAPSG